ncbi:SAC3/GANP/Nin1/mts3/eIF-3 p25 family-domain-containing protein [Aspergillus cavernicola]|uniref:SAC3/GANP/Nin1/mts3/eIF-3 p25 family-domain-containing protein n=1 Tax=Aspergillus cavernicola TaxID=176166 RepID=A0ABR4HSK4_9EURO
MAGPANPFAVLHQTGGAASSTGRGRGGAFSRPTPSQPRGASTNVPQDINFRGRGRGRGAYTGARGGSGYVRGGGAAGNTWRGNKPEAQASSTAPTASSPFAQLGQNQPAAPPVTGQAHLQKPPFSGFGRGSPRPPFGAPSDRGGTIVNSNRDPRKRPVANPTNGVPGANVPVEDASTMGSYNDRYEKLKIDRAKQREKAIKAGQMADPNQPTSLNKAITPVGTCTSMCPDFERVERIVQKMIDKSEKYLHPATNSLQTMEAKMLKRFRRSAAGYDEQLPSDIRTPGTLLQTMNYLTRHIIGGPEPLGIIHKFVWDRTRSIRNDFSVQQVTQEEDVKIAVTCLERIARFHIVSLHLLSSPANEEPFDRHQEREQLNNTMLSLMYYYDDNRGRTSFPNEDEFRAYYIIFSIHDQRPDLEARVQKWPPELRNAPRVEAALELFAAAGNTWEYQGTLDAKRPNAIAQGFYSRFFNLVNSPSVSYLMACVAEIYFNHMRQTAIRSIWKGYCRYPSSQQHKNDEWTVDELKSVLCFDNHDQTIQFCEAQDLQFAHTANGDMYLNWGNRPVDSIGFQPSSDHSFSENYVESKRAGRNLASIVLGLNVREAASLGMIDRSLISERSTMASTQQMSIDNDDSLFVSEDENEKSPSVPQLNGDISMDSEPSAGPISFGNILQAATSNMPGPSTSGLAFPSTPNESQPPVTPNPPPSFFSTSNSESSTATHSIASLNPFAKPFTPFPPAQTPEQSPPSTISSIPANKGQSPNVFSNAATIAQSSQSVKAPTTPAATPFKLPNVSQPTMSQTSSFAFFQSVSQPQPTTPASPFGLPQAPLDVKHAKPDDPTAGQSSTSIFDVAKPSPPPQPSSSLFNLGTTPGPVIQKPETSTPEVSKPQPPAASPQLFSPPFQAAKNTNEAPSIFSNAPKPAKQTNTTFGAPSIFSTTQKQPEQSNAVFKAPFSPPAFETSANTPSTSHKSETPTTIPAVRDVTLSASNGVVEHPISSSSPAESNKVKTAAPTEPFPDVQPEIPEVVTDAPVEAISEEQAFNKAERQTAWIHSLREAADRRRNTVSTPASRKRVLEHETPPRENVVKAPKVPKAEARPRKSMALSSVKPLPKLPILEAMDSMTARNPVEKKPEPRKPSQVDEDELLLSAARIAAESLRSGPRLMDGFSAPYEPWRSSYSPGSSVASSAAFSRSVSPQQSLVNGYDVAFAPEKNLGLGRSLSRTEQRIRLTGGKGLAYKPLNLTPEQSWRSSPKK